MKKRIVTLVVFLLIACVMLTGCASEETKVENTAAPETATVETTNGAQDSDGMYEWTLSNGIILKTKTNVMDYIQDGIWDSNQMAIDLGWIGNDQTTKSEPTGYSLNDSFISFIMTRSPNKEVYSWYCYSIGYLHDERLFYVVFSNEPGEYIFSKKDSNNTISLDGIILTTYACEQLTVNPAVDPFDGVLGELSNYEYNLLGN